MLCTLQSTCVPYGLPTLLIIILYVALGQSREFTGAFWILTGCHRAEPRSHDSLLHPRSTEHLSPQVLCRAGLPYAQA